MHFPYLSSVDVECFVDREEWHLACSVEGRFAFGHRVQRQLRSGNRHFLGPWATLISNEKTGPLSPFSIDIHWAWAVCTAKHRCSPTVCSIWCERGKENKPVELFDFEGWSHNVPKGEAHPVKPLITAKVDAGNTDGLLPGSRGLNCSMNFLLAYCSLQKNCMVLTSTSGSWGKAKRIVCS